MGYGDYLRWHGGHQASDFMLTNDLEGDNNHVVWCVCVCVFVFLSEYHKAGARVHTSSKQDDVHSDSENVEWCETTRLGVIEITAPPHGPGVGTDETKTH